MSLLVGFWQFLNTDVREMPWGDLAEKGIESVAASNDFAESFKEQAPNIRQLQPYLQQVEPFLKVLDAPVTQLAVAGLPFVSIGIGLLRIYLDQSKVEPTYESAVTIAAQLAYLQSLETVLQKVNDETIKTKLQQVSLKTLVGKQLNSLGDLEIESSEAKTITSRFRESALAAKLNQTLAEQFQGAGLDDADSSRLVGQVMWGTHRYIHQAIAEAGDSVKPLADFYRTGGQQVQDRYESIETYLNKTIALLPNDKVFDESNPLIRFQDIYVPLKVQPLTQAGGVDQEREKINIHEWALGVLEQPDEPRKVMFVEGDAGRGKSVFCRMFADLARRELEFSYIPLVIRLRNLHHLESNLTETLEKCPELEQQSFVQDDSGWLADPNTRFLLILDGFDELLLEGRATGGLKEFLQQVSDFQVRSHHQCIVTGRPLALQGIERLITQTKNLERVRLEPMDDVQREQWLANWQKIFGAEEVEKFRAFIGACPKDIENNLAREPLLIYLLARLHREGHLTSDMFAGTDQRIQAKLRVYRESVRWVLEKQRQDQNLRLAGLEDTDDLLEILQETALCVVQSGNEMAQLTMLKDRFKDSKNPVADLLKESRDNTGQSEDKALNNLLTTFYLNPGEGDLRGSVEFAHKSFGEYLFAERLISAFAEWTEVDKRKRFRMSEGTLHWQIYDLLGYGGMSGEIVEYLMELLAESEIDQVQLFGRLHEFYLLWCDGEFLDREPNDNFPQKKMLQLKKQEVATGLKQVDIWTGLNIIIVLFRLHATAQLDNYPYSIEESPKPAINFHPCGKPETDSFDEYRLLNIIHYATFFDLRTFSEKVGKHLTKANLYRASFYRACLLYADFNSADLRGVNFISADLRGANFTHANLCHTEFPSANLIRANFREASLVRATFRMANLKEANFKKANLMGANLKEANLMGANLIATDLRGANLKEANLMGANLASTNLRGANLISTDLRATNLTDADLKGANLRGANLTNANLIDTNLTGTDLSNVKLNNVLLLEIDLRQTLNLNNDQFNLENEPPLICGTLLPEGLDVDAHRDWDRLAEFLHDRRPHEFETLEEAEAWVNKRRP